MWRLKYISAINFSSFSEVEYSFENKCYVIQAHNKDNSGQQSNGGGKTSLVDIIAVALLGYSLNGRDVKKCVSWNCVDEFLSVDCMLHNKEHNLECLISRKIYSNTKSSELTILINDEIPNIPTKKGVKNGVDVRAGDEYILNSILDIKADDLLNYFLISGKYYQPFLKVTTDKKLDVIGRFTNTKVVDRTINKISAGYKEEQKQIEVNQVSISKAEGYIEALELSLNESGKQEFEKHKEQRLLNIDEKISSISEQIMVLEDRIDASFESKADLQLHEIDNDQRQELNALYELTVTGDREQEKEDVLHQIGHVKNYLAGVIACPKCKHKFNLDSEEKYTDNDLVNLENKLLVINEQINKNTIQAKQINELLSEIDDLERQNKTTQSEIIAIERSIKSLEQQQKRLIEELADHEREKEDVTTTTFNDQRAEVDQQIYNKSEEIDLLKLQRKELDKELEQKSKWLNHFEDFKFYLGNKPLTIVCGLVNQYLEFIGSDLSLYIEGFKKLKSGEIRQSLNPIIYRSGMNPHDYNEFSGGEKARLDIAVDLAFQQLINHSSKFGGLDLYISDELLNPVDSLGIKNAAEALNELNKTILLVSHSGSDLNYSNTIMIEKKNGVSKICGIEGT